jgi:hypothetical protein
MGSAVRTRQAGHGVPWPDRQGRQADATPWVQTPVVLPGESLSIDLAIKATGSTRPPRSSGEARRGGQGQDRPFQVFSRSVEQEQGPAVVEEGVVQIRGGFWTHPFLPYAVILVSALALLAFAFWLASGGVLPW